MDGKFSFESRITIAYLIVGVFWILTSDILAKALISDINRLSYFQSLKGVIFVLLSAAVIFFIARHYNKKQQSIKRSLQDARKKAEESEQLKSAFLANLSHEIRTPMNGIIGFVSLLKSADLNTDKHENYLDYLMRSSERMLETINDIIEISQIESNQTYVNISEVNLNELILSIYLSFSQIAGKNNLTLILNNNLPDKDFSMMTDRNKINAILGNFLKNAIKFSSKGTIELGCFSQDKEVLFYVKDQGIGVSADVQKNIFEPFVQGDITISRPYEGTGLGLSIAKAYAGLLGGKIWLDSLEGKGSTFWFSIQRNASGIMS